MPPDPPVDPPSDLPKDAPTTDAPAAPAEPVSPAKEWAAAIVLMIVLALISAAFMSAFRG